MTSKKSDASTRRTTRRAPAAHERQRDPERTKALIVDAATEVFSAKGFAGARVSEIAARAGVNQQLISYYFDGKEGLYREIGRRWRAYEAEAMPDDMGYAEMIMRYVRASVDPRLGGRLLAWEGLADTGEDDEGAAERDARLQQEVAAIRGRQLAGELDDRFDPAALLLIQMSAANALAVYPQLARGLFGADGSSAEVVEHYAGQLAKLIECLAGSGSHRSA
ncbi:MULTISPECIES: TetR/AcrR family transcriptional regulator [unclassified Streptomyces]|uniref:TetR/AcrR family transcriptional regulator n=1 Tax=unclassified Streptomyces TaxID=2593676 RepID=UPI00036FB485|nr:MULTISPECIES: TetR/AcrR family transcriptional regulator [unclassified Streptomyces]MYT29940.1 TetR family transcriptional regulator [Streptomyces sp. SID8354]